MAPAAPSRISPAHLARGSGIILPLLCALGLTIQSPAAEISWETPQSITGQLSDFETGGTVVHAWNAGGGNLVIGPGTLDLQFTHGPSLAEGDYGGIDPHNRNGDINYETLLGTMSWARATEELVLTGLVPGSVYRVQLWLADTRPGTQHRLKTYDSGPSTTPVVLNSGPPSQWVSGSFIADATSQVLRCVGGSGADHPQYNALVLRELGPPVPKVKRYELSRGAISSDRGLLVSAGETVLLHWDIDDADWVTISPIPGPVPAGGSVQLSPTATQTYQLSAGNGEGTINQSITVFIDEPVTPPELSEILPSNDRGIEDEDGDHEDWIELYNPNSFALPLDSFTLSDDPTQAATWAFPADAFIPADGHLLVFASGKNRTGAELHTDFKLDADGDYLALLENGVLLEQWPADHPATPMFPQVKEDFSYGRNPSGQFRFFDAPTPGSANGDGFLGWVQDTAFSVDRGFFDTTQSVAITSPTLGADIRYTTDGSLPSPTHGTLYTGPVAIDATTVLRAIAYQSGHSPTNIDTQTYIFPSDVINSPVMNTDITQSPVHGPQMEAALLALPAISLTIEDPGTLDTSTEHATSVEFLPVDGTTGFQVDAGVTHFGGYYTNFDKKNFRLYFRRDYGPGKLDYPLFDGFENGIAAVEKFDALDLRSGSHDMKMRGAYLSNRFTDDSTLEMGHFAPHGRFVHLFINGVYWGQYHLRERWQAAMAAEYFGGDKDDYEAINGNANVGGNFGAGVPYDGDGSGWLHIKQLAAGGTPWLDLPSRVDLANYLDFMLLFMSGKSETEFRNINQPFDGGVGMKIYLNDADGFLRSPPDRTGNGGPGNLLGYLRAENDPDFRVFLADLIQEHFFHGGAMTPERTVARLQRLVDATRLSFLCESARWTGTTAGGAQLYRYPTRTPESWQSYQDNLLNNHLPALTATTVSRLRSAGLYPSIDAPNFNQDGGVVSPGFWLLVNSPSGGITYLTTTGEDPRLPGGGIHPGAIVLDENTGGLTLVGQGSDWRYLDNGSNQGSAWRAEGFDDSSWSSGPAQLGYGDGDETTVVSYGSSGSNKHITTYFRKTFEVPDPGALTALSLELLRDDGAVVYLNGNEVARSNLPTGSITYSTLANGAIGGSAESVFTQFALDPTALHTGTNTLAVEIHQTKANSSDISFDLRLLASTAAGAGAAHVFSSGTTTIKARTLVGNEWSALREERFIVSAPPVAPAPGDLVISELLYHPTDPTAAELAIIPDLIDEDFEFLELLNLSSDPLRLDGYAFTDGIDYVFAEDSILQPGERLVLVSNADAFALRHGSAVHGAYSGALSNGGESVVLSNPADQVLLAFTFGDGTDPDWPVDPDGGGSSLVLIHPAGTINPDDPFAWRASTTAGGNPGSTDATASDNPLADNDGDGQPALIEALLMSSDQTGDSLPDLETFFATHPDGNDYLHLRIRRDLTIEASLHVKTSTNLLNWSQPAVLYQRTRHGDLTETLEYHFPTPYAGTQHAFMRIHAWH